MSDFSVQFSSLEAKVDNINDARRVLRIYGTAKKDVGYISKFCANSRIEDAALLEHLLALKTEPEPTSCSLTPVYGASLISVYNEVPKVVTTLLRSDEKLRALYEGNGKIKGDTTGSGYDISLVRRLLVLGIHDVSILATVLAHRPKGSVQNSNKGESYLRHTIAAAISGK